MKTTSETEQKLYKALKGWAEMADSTPDDPNQGVVLTYHLDDGTLGFWKDFYEDEFSNLGFGDLVEAEELLGYDKIANELLKELKDCVAYNEESAKDFIKYLNSAK